MIKADPREIPIQAVEKPIICNPYDEPTHHWVYDTVTGEAEKLEGRRPASYWYKTKKQGLNSRSSLLLPRNSEMTSPWLMPCGRMWHTGEG